MSKNSHTDIHSYANFQEIVVTHVFSYLTVCFETKSVFGSVVLTSKFLQDGVNKIKLDTKGIEVKSANLEGSDKNLEFSIPTKSAAIGDCLQISIPEGKKGEEIKIEIKYTTVGESGGIQWFAPEQTSGKRHPFFYTQFEAILARTMIPLMDTPSVKTPYDMKIILVQPLVAACSGQQVGEPEISQDGKTRTFHFRQANPIPSYLIALACGELVKKPIGPRSSVWAEPELVDAAQEEYRHETESFIAAAEKIAGLDYQWGVYDLLILPPTFPYGGMENPNLTFINSCLITGDRSLTDVVAHEIAHSWAGNLVTNCNWTDFWLNEGFTMYLERLILGAIHGEKMRHFHHLLGYGELVRTVNDFKQENQSEFSKLCPNLTGIDPDDAFSRIPYEKGCLFILYLEKVVGGKDRIIDWLRVYFKDFATKSVSSLEMKEHFISYFKDLKAEIDWDTWLNGEYLPPYNPIADLDDSIFKKCDKLVDLWKKNGGEGASASDLTDGWDAAMTMVFLDELLNSFVPTPHALLEKMNGVYAFSKSNNPEISYRWWWLCLKSDFAPENIVVGLEDFLSKNGRGVYLKPLYREFIRVAEKKVIELAVVKKIYQKYRPVYHSVIRNTFDDTLL